jgi:hypothetical protein
MKTLVGAALASLPRPAARSSSRADTRATRLAFAGQTSLLLAALASLCATALLALPAGASAAACPNEAFRTGLSAALPDCRAYEMVSPPGFMPMNGILHNGSQASSTGGRFSFYSKFGAPPGSSSYGGYYLSTRGPSGWSTADMVPPQSTAGGDFCNPSVLFSPDLSKSVLQDGWNWGESYPIYLDDNGSQNCSHDEPELVAGEPHGAQNLFLREGSTGSFQLINATAPGSPARDAWFQAGSEDFSHIVFTDPLKLTSDAPQPPEFAVFHYAMGEDLYVRYAGTDRLVTRLPDGTPVWGLLANGDESGSTGGSAQWTHAVSTDGERVLFYAGGEVVRALSEEHYVGGSLYMRENAAREQSAISAGTCTEAAKACTVQIDLPAPGVVGAGGGGHFQWASADGSRVFFTDESKLTTDAGAEAGKPDLYEYNSERPEATRLLDLTAGAPEPANVQGLSGVSADGSHVYFVAEGKLTGAQENGWGGQAQTGRPNLYLRSAGITTFIATLDIPSEDPQAGKEEQDFCAWDSYTPPGKKPRGEESSNCMSARVSPDGTFLAL